MLQMLGRGAEGVKEACLAGLMPVDAPVGPVLSISEYVMFLTSDSVTPQCYDLS